MLRTRTSWLLAAAAVLIVAGCGTSAATIGTTTAIVAAPTTMVTSTTTTTSATTTVPVTTSTDRPDNPATVPMTPATVPMTPATAATTPVTAPPTTATAGWVSGDWPDAAYVPCCLSYYHGPRSPAFPANAQAPLADGFYPVSVIGDDGTESPLFRDGDTVRLQVARFELCSITGDCDPEYAGDGDLTTTGPTRTFNLALDANLHIGLLGVNTDTCHTTVYGTGADLAALRDAYATAFAQVIAPRVAAGEPTEQIVATIAAHPQAGFHDSCWTPGYGLDFTIPGRVGSVFAVDGQFVTPLPGLWLEPLVLEARNGQYTLYIRDGAHGG